MLTPDLLYKLLAIADVHRDPYAVAAAAGALLAANPYDTLAPQYYARALLTLKLTAASHRLLRTACPPGPPPGVVPWASRARRFAANLRALESRCPAGAALVASAATQLSDYELHLASDGNYQVLDLAAIARGIPVHAAWLGGTGPLVDHKANTKLWPFDRTQSPLPRPVAFDGMGMGWIPLHVAQATRRSLVHYSCALYILEPDPLALAILLHLHDLCEFIADPRTRFFIGDSAPAVMSAFRHALDASPQWSIPGGIIRCALRQRPGVSFEETIKDLQAARDNARTSLLESVRRHYASFTGESWPRRFDDALTGRGEPLRVLGITSRYTTVLQHSLEELKTAVDSAGRAQMTIAIEPDDQSLEHPFLEMIAQLKPDLIVQISRMRYENPLLPDNIPFLTWDQDNLPYMRTQRATASVAENSNGQLTFVAGHGALHGFTHLNWPKRSVIFCHLAAAAHRYRPRTLTAGESARYACDLSYVSNASAPAESIRDMHIKRFGHPEAALLTALCDVILARSPDVPDPSVWNETTLRAAAAQVVADRGITLSPAALEEIVLVSVLVADRVFRHQTLEWVGDFALQSGRSLKLYGAGWETHPRFARFAAGPAAQGAELQAITLASRINLQIIGTGVLHARMLDGLAGGGFFMFRRTDNDRADPGYLEHLQIVSRHVFEMGIDSFGTLDRTDSPGIRAAWAAIGPAYRAQLQRIGVPEKHLLRGLSAAHLLGHALALLPELAEVGFDSREDFAAKAAGFLDDDSRRMALAAALRERVLKDFSYDSRWHTFIEHIRRNL